MYFIICCLSWKKSVSVLQPHNTNTKIDLCSCSWVHAVVSVYTSALVSLCSGVDMPLFWVSLLLFSTSLSVSLWNDGDRKWADLDGVRAERCWTAVLVFLEFTVTWKWKKTSEETSLYDGAGEGGACNAMLLNVWHRTINWPRNPRNRTFPEFTDPPLAVY